MDSNEVSRVKSTKRFADRIKQVEMFRSESFIGFELLEHSRNPLFRSEHLGAEQRWLGKHVLLRLLNISLHVRHSEPSRSYAQPYFLNRKEAALLKQLN